MSSWPSKVVPEGKQSIAGLDVGGVMERLRREGAIHFTGFEAGLSDFKTFSESIGEGFSGHGSPYRSGHVPDEPTVNFANPGLHALPLHSEMSYLPHRPELLWFHCAHALADGGETWIAHGAHILSKLSRATVDVLRSRKLTYCLPLPTFSWPQYYLSENADVVAATLGADRDVDFARVEVDRFEVGLAAMREFFGEQRTQKILAGKLLAGTQAGTQNGIGTWFLLKYRTSAIQSSPLTGEEAFSCSILQTIPMGITCFEDGEEIPEEMHREIREAAAAVTVPIRWTTGDLVLVDNYRVLHGRPAFGDGKRRLHVRQSQIRRDVLEQLGS